MMDWVIHGQMGNVLVNHVSYMCHVWVILVKFGSTIPWVISVIHGSYGSCMGHIGHVWVNHVSYMGHLLVNHTIGYTVPVCYPQGPLSLTQR